MSTKDSIKFEVDDSTGVCFHIYKECLELENVYLELTGFPIDVDIQMDDVKPRITARFPLAWALKLGLVNEEYVAQHEQWILDEKAGAVEKELPEVSTPGRAAGTSGWIRPQEF